MHAEELLSRLGRLRVGRAADGSPSPNKPIVLLWAIARVQHAQDRLARFEDVRDELDLLLARFGAANRTSSHMPFWHLQSTGIWEVRHAESPDLAGRSRPSLTAMNGAYGGLTLAAAELLAADPAGRDATINLLMSRIDPAKRAGLSRALRLPSNG